MNNPPPGLHQSNNSSNGPFDIGTKDNQILAAMPLATLQPLSFDSNSSTIAAFPLNPTPTVPYNTQSVASPALATTTTTHTPPMPAAMPATVPPAASAPTTAAAPSTTTTESHSAASAKKRKKALRKIEDMEPAPPPSNRMDRSTADATCQRLVAILAMNSGFSGISSSALYHLTSLFEHYTQQLYSVAHAFAEHAGRTQPNVHDLQQALRDVKTDPLDLIKYIKKAKESNIPLLKGALKETIPEPKKFKKEDKPVLVSDDEEQSEMEDEILDEEEQQLQEKSRRKDGASAGPVQKRVPIRQAVPDHLPPFPSKHTYKQTPVFYYRATDPQTIREMNAEQSRLVETNLKRLMAAENKISMAQHKDTLDTLDPTTGRASSAAMGMAMSDDDDDVSMGGTSSRSVSKSQMRLEALPIVNYENARRQQQQQRQMQQGSTSKVAAAVVATAQDHHQQQLQQQQHRALPAKAGSIGAGADGTTGNNHMRVLSTASTSATSCAVSTKEAWRRERRRMRKLQNDMATSQ